MFVLRIRNLAQRMGQACASPAMKRRTVIVEGPLAFRMRRLAAARRFGCRQLSVDAHCGRWVFAYVAFVWYALPAPRAGHFDATTRSP